MVAGAGTGRRRHRVHRWPGRASVSGATDQRDHGGGRRVLQALPRAPGGPGRGADRTGRRLQGRAVDGADRDGRAGRPRPGLRRQRAGGDHDQPVPADAALAGARAAGAQAARRRTLRSPGRQERQRREGCGGPVRVAVRQRAAVQPAPAGRDGDVADRAGLRLPPDPRRRQRRQLPADLPTLGLGRERLRPARYGVRAAV